MTKRDDELDFFEDDEDVREIMRAFDQLASLGWVALTRRPDDEPMLRLHDPLCVQDDNYRDETHADECDCWCHDEITDTLFT